jgi:hypothetical protein
MKTDMSKHELEVLIRFHRREKDDLLNIPAEQSAIKYHLVRINEYKEQIKGLTENYE